VVERTVEKVVPGQQASVITKETTVVVKEEDLIIDAVDKNRRNVVVFEREGESVGLGFIVSQEGLVATDSSVLFGEGEIKASLSNQKKYSIEIVKSDSLNSLTLVKLIVPEDLKEETKFNKVGFSDLANLKLGQTVIALGGLEERAITTGVVAKINTKDLSETTDSTQTTPQKIISSIEISPSVGADFEGSPLIDIDGLVLGINITSAGKSFSLPSSLILEIISELRTDKKTSIN